MEKLINIFPPQSNFEIINNNLITLTKWNWEYESFLSFQKSAQEIIRTNKKLKLYIFCNHPHCFTLGRGNERGDSSLINFSEESIQSLALPLHKIHRGGGITFHHPGQWIMYPIQNVSPSDSLEDLMCWMLKSVRDVLKKDFRIDDLLAANKLMGIWKEKRKLASIGMGMSRFVTEHGLALNLTIDNKMENALASIFPCGLNSTIYTCVSEYIDDQSEEEIRTNFHKKFVEFLKV